MHSQFFLPTFSGGKGNAFLRLSWLEEKLNVVLLGVNVSSLDYAVFHGEEEADSDLQTGIEVGAECMETRRQVHGATAGARSSLSSECQCVECCMLRASSLALS